jgi:c-di-GMP-binding flagellar brake protein YcgR
MQVQTKILERQRKAYLIADLLKVNEEYNALEGDEAREAYILSRRQKVQDIISVIRQSRPDDVVLMF